MSKIHTYEFTYTVDAPSLFSGKETKRIRAFCAADAIAQFNAEYTCTGYDRRIVKVEAVPDEED